MFCKTLGARFMSAMASNSYKPVVLVHGVLAGAPSLEYLKEKIEIVSFWDYYANLIEKLNFFRLILERM